MGKVVYALDPFRDRRWSEFINKHAEASVFHTTGWLEALFRTYGYEPVVLTTSVPGMDLTNGLVFSQVDSRLTGRRLVSLPFTDHCQPLLDQAEDLESLLTFLHESAQRQGWKYTELRPLGWADLTLKWDGISESSENYVLHRLDLKPRIEEIFQGFHRSCVQRKIQRAEREALTYEEGRSEAILTKFYRLLVRTRRRHGLPPQPLDWFRNLIDCLGDQVSIRVASKNGKPVASILTLSFKKTIVYKYGCSDARFHNLGGMPFLFWKAIQEAKKQGLEEFDLGRSDPDNSGLSAFKDHLGATRSTLTYYRYPAAAGLPLNGWKLQVAKRVFAHLPTPLLTATGRLFYKHIG